MAQEKKDRSIPDGGGIDGVIKVTAVGVKSRWRAGLQFGPEPTQVDRAALTKDQFDALESDPFLKIER